MEVDTTPAMAEHEVGARGACRGAGLDSRKFIVFRVGQVNTERVVHKNAGMRHVQGGWPENVDGTEADQVDRYLKKFNKARARARPQARA